MIGKKLGRYDIVRVLNKGAMGMVYEAHDPVLQRQVAIKTILVEKRGEEASREYEQRFAKEALAGAKLLHPNIVPVFDFGHEEDVAYLVMQLVAGHDLRHHLDIGRRFPPPMAVAMALDLLAALDHAHRHDVVHRDVKPANMLLEKGRVKLTDFGVARLRGLAQMDQTEVGAAGIGTPRYMSPEQAEGQPVDARSDLFSAGVVLYELLAGLRPFDAETPMAVLHQVVTRMPPPPSNYNKSVPPGIDAVVLKALAKKPDDRFPSARDFALALRAASRHITGTAGAPQSVATARPGSAGSLPPITQELELVYWKDIKDSQDPTEFAAFLRRFPDGMFAALARKRFLKYGGVPWQDATPPATPAFGDPTGDDEPTRGWHLPLPATGSPAVPPPASSSGLGLSGTGDVLTDVPSTIGRAAQRAIDEARSAAARAPAAAEEDLERTMRVTRETEDSRRRAAEAAAMLEEARRAQAEEHEAEARRLELERGEAEARRVEHERVEADARRAEQEHAEAEARRAEDERHASEARRLEQERQEAEARRAEQDRIEAEARRAEQDRIEAEARRAEQERLVAEAQRLAQERAEADARRVADDARRQEQDRADAEARRAMEQARRQEQERIEAESRRLVEEAKRLEQERLAHEARVAEGARKLEQERQEAERLAAEAREAQRRAAEQVEAERRERERLQRERDEAEERRRREEALRLEALRAGEARLAAERQRHAADVEARQQQDAQPAARRTAAPAAAAADPAVDPVFAFRPAVDDVAPPLPPGTPGAGGAAAPGSRMPMVALGLGIVALGAAFALWWRADAGRSESVAKAPTSMPSTSSGSVAPASVAAAPVAVASAAPPVASTPASSPVAAVTTAPAPSAAEVARAASAAAAEEAEARRREAEKQANEARRREAAKRIEEEAKLALQKRQDLERRDAERRAAQGRESEERGRADEERRLAEQRRQDEERRLAEQKRAEDEKRLAEQRRAEEDKRVAEAKQREEEQRRQVAQRQAEAQRLIESKRSPSAAASLYGQAAEAEKAGRGDEAVRIYKRAADAGSAAAARRLAEMYTGGHGVPRDAQEGGFWRTRAAEMEARGR